MLLLKFNADVGIINAEGHKAGDIARTVDIRNLIKGNINACPSKIRITFA